LAVSVVAGFLGGVAMFGAISFVPLFAQGSLGYSATEAGSLLTPLMLSWVTMSVIGGRLMLRLGYRSITIAGYTVLTIGFIPLAMFGRGVSRVWLYGDLMLVGAGLGLTMLTLLIAVQQAVERSKLGVATSLNQFSRAIGGAIGVAIMGAVLSAGLARNLRSAASTGALTPPQAEAFAANPNALIEPGARASVAPETLAALQTALSDAIHPVFWVGALMAALGLITVLFLPKAKEIGERENVDGERLILAEQTTINARNQPVIRPEKL